MQHIPNFVGGEHVPPESNDYLDNVEPATGTVYSRVAASGPADVERAAKAAAAAFPDWSATPAAERCELLLDVAARIEADLEGFARAESIDTGKPIHLARNVDIPRAIANFRFFATAITHWSSESHSTDRLAINYTLRRPRGVAGLISPWNLPLYLLSWKVAPAIAAGNTAVAKPSELTPMTAHMLTEVCREAGLPAGVLNVVHGRGPEVGGAITAHPGVGTISFTGGTATGREIASTTGPMFKKIALEMGGKNPNIIFADAPMKDALSTSLRAAFTNQGQICLCGSRIFVERPAYDEFVERFVAGTRKLRTGDPLEEATEQGAIVSEPHLFKVLSYVELAREEGGTVHCGGRPAENLPERCSGGYFVEPTVITGLGPGCRVNQEEIFGPVVTIMPFDDEREVVEAANSTPYGLSATIWTENLARAHRMAESVASGTIWVNCWMVRDLRVPFGGTKASGVGREGGEEALRFFTDPKNVCVHIREENDDG